MVYGAGEGPRASVGAAHVMQTVVGAAQARNRQFTAVAATVETATWDDGVNEVTITAYPEDASDTYTALGVCFGAPSDATAAAWLTYAESKAADTNMVVIPSGQSRTFYFSGDGITRLDVKRVVGTDAMGVTVEAA